MGPAETRVLHVTTVSLPCRSGTGETHVQRDEEACSAARGAVSALPVSQNPNSWRQNHPVVLCHRDHFALRPSADPERLLFFESSFISPSFSLSLLFFFCCCSYFPLSLIIQMCWGPCALPHHKGNHRTSDQRICQMSSPGRAPCEGHGYKSRLSCIHEAQQGQHPAKGPHRKQA